MKKIILIFAAAVVATGIASSCKKDGYRYTCTCQDPSRGLADTAFTIGVETSGEAYFICKSFGDTATKYGRPYVCDIED